MERGVKNWMFVSIALLLAEIGRLLGGHFHWEVAERSFDAVAVLLIVIMGVRFFVRKWRR